MRRTGVKYDSASDWGGNITVSNIVSQPINLNTANSHTAERDVSCAQQIVSVRVGRDEHAFVCVCNCERVCAYVQVRVSVSRLIELTWVIRILRVTTVLRLLALKGKSGNKIQGL